MCYAGCAAIGGNHGQTTGTRQGHKRHEQNQGRGQDLRRQRLSCIFRQATGRSRPTLDCQGCGPPSRGRDEVLRCPKARLSHRRKRGARAGDRIDSPRRGLYARAQKQAMEPCRVDPGAPEEGPLLRARSGRSEQSAQRRQYPPLRSPFRLPGHLPREPGGSDVRSCRPRCGGRCGNRRCRQGRRLARHVLAVPGGWIRHRCHLEPRWNRPVRSAASRPVPGAHRGRGGRARPWPGHGSRHASADFGHRCRGEPERCRQRSGPPGRTSTWTGPWNGRT